MLRPRLGDRAPITDLSFLPGPLCLSWLARGWFPLNCGGGDREVPARASALAAVLAATLAVLGAPAQADPIAMPAGSTVWMHFEAASCPDADGDDCVGSTLPGAAPPNGIPLTTFVGSSSTGIYDAGRFATAYAELLPDRVRTFGGGNGTWFMRVSFEDTYTVHGAAAGSFPITVTLSASGTARSVPNPPTPLHLLASANVGLEIGTFSPTDVAIQEQFRVTPFVPGGSSDGFWSYPTTAQAAPFEVPFSLSATHTLNVGVGDVFDLAFGINSASGKGEIDLLNTAWISFTLPEGVYLTSGLGGTWGVVPEPSTFVLLAGGLGALAAGRRGRAAKR